MPPHQSAIQGRVFLVGCPRSGTTLLQSLLAAHPAIASFPETHFFPTLRPNSLWRRLLRLAAPDIRSWFEHFLADLEEDVTMSSSPQGYFMASYVEAFVHLLDTLTRRRNKRIWIEKTPRHLHHISVIEAYISDARFIHLVRRGRDVVASLYEVTHKHPDAWNGARTVDECIERWKRDVRRTRRHATQPQHTAVQYERLAETPATVLQHLCAFLGVDYDPAMLDHYSQAAARVTRTDESWKERTSSAIRPPSSDKFHRIFNEEEKRYIMDQLSSFDLSEMPFD